MNTILVAAFSVTVYALVQIADAKVIQKEKPNPKAIMRRCALMFVSVLAGLALYDQFGPLVSQIGDKIESVGSSGNGTGGSGTGGSGNAKVFTDNPGF